ncbi:GNAT family N-acetyltransferase [Tsuneonella mangrovi]|uniref:GNAT family N-acetyltransferase n=1 Tax=Tsuneonella mangrovi TaxID=1982042 RepID=UPI001F0A0A91|nr:GNAT family N-acetyltransferase [Tsuneonella mangrovi]
MIKSEVRAPVVVTDRLELWLPRPSDEAEMFAIVSHPETGRFLGPTTVRAEHVTRFQRGAGSWFLWGYGFFMVRLRGQHEVIGNCGVFRSYRGLGEDMDDKPEAGWIFAAGHVGKGYATEAMRAVLDWFDAEHGSQEIMCMIAPENAPSLGVARKLGFAPTRLATLPDGDEVQLLRREAAISVERN